MRISDWRSDVCSSDLAGSEAPVPEDRDEAIGAEAIIVAALRDMLTDPEAAFQTETALYQDFSVRCRMQRPARAPLDLPAFRRRLRSEARRVGKGCVSQCRTRV